MTSWVYLFLAAMQTLVPVAGVSLEPSAGLSHIRATEGKGTDVICMAEGGGDPPEWLHFYQLFPNGTRQDLGAGGIGVQWITQEKPKKLIKSQMLETFDRSSNGSTVECSAQGENGTRHISTHLLEVYWMPDILNFTMSPDKDVIAAGYDVTFRCTSAGGYPENATVSLEYGGKTLQLINGSMTLYDVTDDESGRYTCTVTNRAGTVTRHLFLAVQKEALSLKESIGPLILTIVVTLLIVAIIAAFFLFFMCRGDPDKRKRKKKPKCKREPRFRPPKPDKSQKKQKTPPPKPFEEFTPIVNIPVTATRPHDENGRLNHVPPPRVPTKPVEEDEVMADVNEVVLEMPPTPSVKRSKEVDPNGTLDSNKFADGGEFKFVDEDSEGEMTRL